MFNTVAQYFDRMMRRYTPDPFIIAAVLTFLVFGGGLLVTETTPRQMVMHWGDGFWGIMTFTLQMCMVLVGGYVVASAKLVRGFLKRVTSLAKTPPQAVVACTIISCAGCYLNWGFGLVVAAFTCREMIRHVPTANYRLLVASGYSGFLIWHGGLSGSIPLLLATPGNFSEALVGGTIPVEQTLFSPLNLVATIGLCLLLPYVNYRLCLMDDRSDPVVLEDEYVEGNDLTNGNPAEWIEHSFTITVALSALAGSFLYFSWENGDFKFDLNRLNFLFIFLGLLLHGRPHRFIKAVTDAGRKVGPLLIQYPLYAGIMGMMKDSGLAALLSEGFVTLSNSYTFPVLTFYSAGLVNLFVPSGGGQWAVQSVIVIPAAKSLGVDIAKASMAVAWGDAWTNLAQPFWALPLLAIAGLRVRDIMGYCITILMVSGLFLSLVFLLL